MYVSAGGTYGVGLLFVALPLVVAQGVVSLQILVALQAAPSDMRGGQRCPSAWVAV